MTSSILVHRDEVLPDVAVWDMGPGWKWVDLYRAIDETTKIFESKQPDAYFIVFPVKVREDLPPSTITTARGIFAGKEFKPTYAIGAGMFVLTILKMFRLIAPSIGSLVTEVATIQDARDHYTQKLTFS